MQCSLLDSACLFLRMLPAVAIKHLGMKSAATYGERKKKKKKGKIKKKIPPMGFKWKKTLSKAEQSFI